jgi:hypothetical protein
LGESFLEKMEIGESLFGKKHGKLSIWKILAPKTIYRAQEQIYQSSKGSMDLL